MKNALLLVFLSIIILSACRTTYDYIVIEPEVVSYTTEDNIPFTEQSLGDITIQAAFVGHGLDYSIFEVEVRNDTDDAIEVSYDDFKIVHSNGLERQAYQKYDFIRELEKEKQTLKKQKRANTIGSIFLGGLTVLGIASGGGTANSVNAITYGLESTLYILDDRRNYNLATGDIEDEIGYINEWVLFESIVLEDSSLSKDVIFSNQDMTTDFDLLVTLDGNDFVIPYDCMVKTEKR